LCKGVHAVGGAATSSILSRSPNADWILLNPGDSIENYLNGPLLAYVGKVIVDDVGHRCGYTCVESIWVGRFFSRGLNVLLMKELSPSPA
jgi:hypothetical protein